MFKQKTCKPEDTLRRSLPVLTLESLAVTNKNLSQIRRTSTVGTNLQRRTSMMTSRTSTSSTIDEIPETYRSHPSRPIAPSLPDTFDSTQQVTAHIGVVVALLAPCSADDAARIQQLQQVRERWDQAYPRWLPHVTLIPPFNIPSTIEREHRPLVPKSVEGSSEQGKDVPLQRTDSVPSKDGSHPTSPRSSKYRPPETVPIGHLKNCLDRISTAVSRTCADFSAHTLTLDDVGSFKLREYTNVHLRPRHHTKERRRAAESELEIIQLQKALADAFAQEGHPGKRQQNRATTRQRERAASANDIPDLTSHVSNASISAQVTAGFGAPRTYSRPHYRLGVVDEARCVTLPTVEVDQPPRNEKAVTRTIASASVRGQTLDEARHGVSSGIPTSSGTEEKRGIRRDPSHATSRELRVTNQRNAKSHDRHFNPHASVGQARGPRECGKLIALAKGVLRGEGDASKGQDAPQGIDCLIDEVYFLTKPVGNAGPYELYSVAHLRD